MSRTVRKKHKWMNSFERELSKEIAYYALKGFKTIERVKKTKEEIKAEREEKIKAYKKPTSQEVYNSWYRQFIYSCNAKTYEEIKAEMNVPPTFIYVSKYRLVEEDISEEQIVEIVKKKIAKYGRDGYCSRSGSNKGFKNEANTYVRNQNKRFCKMVMDGKDVDDVPYPIRKEGRQFSWNWW